jgi:hypothetical protein
MAGFSELWPLGGVGPWDKSTFMMLPKGGANLVLLEGASLRELAYDHNKFVLTEVTNENRLKVEKGLHEEVASRLRPVLGALKKDSRLLLVRKRSGTEDNITIGKGGGAATLQVGQYPLRRYSLAFKFMQHDKSTRPSRWKPEDAAGWLAKLNATYGAQANITFEMAEKPDYFTVETVLPQPIEKKAFENHIVAHKSKVATGKDKATGKDNPPVLTVFLVGKWKSDGGHPNGTTFYDPKVAVITDEPVHPKEAIAAADPFMLTLAHEVGHWVLYQRGFKGEHHHKRQGILHSIYIQSLRFDKQLMNHLNTYG